MTAVSIPLRKNTFTLHLLPASPSPCFNLPLSSIHSTHSIFSSTNNNPSHNPSPNTTHYHPTQPYSLYLIWPLPYLTSTFQSYTSYLRLASLSNLSISQSLNLSIFLFTQFVVRIHPHLINRPTYLPTKISILFITYTQTPLAHPLVLNNHSYLPPILPFGSIGLYLFFQYPVPADFMSSVHFAREILPTRSKRISIDSAPSR